MKIKSHGLMYIIFYAIMFVSTLIFSCRCCAAVTGGYMTASASELVYLRLTQVGTVLDGDINFVDANNTSQGFTAARYNVSGTMVQRHIEIRIDGFLGIRLPLVDGEIKGDRLSLNFPQNNGQFMSVVLHPASALAWNSTVTNFETKQARVATLRQLIRAYNQYRDQYIAAKADLPNAQTVYQSAISDQKNDSSALYTAQLNALQAQQQYTKAKADYDRLDAAWDYKLEGDAYQQQEDNHQKAGQIEADAEESMAESKSALFQAQSDLQNATQAVSEAKNKVIDDMNNANVAYSNAVQAAGEIKQIVKLVQDKPANEKHIHRAGK